jgi:hypothetical protein
VVVGTLGAERAETLQVVRANILLALYVLELTVSKTLKITEFAKTSFVIGTPLSLFVATDCG